MSEKRTNFTTIELNTKLAMEYIKEHHDLDINAVKEMPEWRK
jgi:hypothetical protein